MIDIQINDGTRQGVITFQGDEVTEPCSFDVSGEFSIADIEAIVWLATMTADGTGQGIHELQGQVSEPRSLILALRVCAVQVTGVPQDWEDEMDSIEQDAERRFEEGAVC
ncbi:hypothetical protein CYR55_22650 [Chimaeribacter californicus]|uniref:Uncharacterized protein n=1 Tax=Chimaeribacter californicus TaxID=2060067 RepID=A0A2N5DTG9_9GAMM|nr:hypothetical protein [Chimaeribacter californicus]PLR29724.1 hypothetical protein CYR55_22650 [Chimaeribacter californicus]